MFERIVGRQVERGPKPTSGDGGNGSEGSLTEIVARDGKTVVATITADLAEVQKRGEAEAKGRDPVARMSEVLEEQLREAGAELMGDSRIVLRSALSRYATSRKAPSEIAITARRLAGAVPSAGGAKRPGEVKRDARDVQRSAARDGDAFPPELFEKVVRFPHPRSKERYDDLIGLDEVKARLQKEAIVLTQPDALVQWARRHHGDATLGVMKVISLGTPLVIFAGDVGTGKSQLAVTFGAAVADALGKPAVLLRMSIATRGKGFVGDMTQQIVRAIGAVEAEARKTGNVTILLVDEADAMAESRDTREMHHEDRAGVNALIQGVDRLRDADLPVLVVFCTNRLSSLDPAVRRRAVDVFEFTRPNEDQRRALFEKLLEGLTLGDDEIHHLVLVTGPRNGRSYGFTYSDVVDRLARSAVIRAFPDRPLTFGLLRELAEGMEPTRPFGIEGD